MVYFSPTQVTFVSSPTENPMWYPIENAKATSSNTNAKEEKKSTNRPKGFNNLFMAPPCWRQVISLPSLPGDGPFLTARNFRLERFKGNIHAKEWSEAKCFMWKGLLLPVLMLD